jgi:hypothetical protein
MLAREKTSVNSVQYSQDARTTAQEVTCVIVSVEADQVTVKYTQQDLVSDRQNAVDLGAGKRCVEEETKLDVLLGIANLLAQHSRQEH